MTHLLGTNVHSIEARPHQHQPPTGSRWLPRGV